MAENRNLGIDGLINEVLTTKEFVVFASAARTTTHNSSDFTNYGHKGVKLFIDCTAVTDTPSVVFTVTEKDPIGGDYHTILTSAAVAAAITAPVVLTIYPGVTVTTNVSASEPIPKTWRVTATHADADSITYSISGCYIP